MEKHSDNTAASRAPWGEGRIVFLAHAEQIQRRIAEGWPLKRIYQELETALNGLSYQQFTYHVRKRQASGRRDNTTSRQSPTPEREPDETHNTKASTRFKPGPRVPDPKQLY